MKLKGAGESALATDTSYTSIRNRARIEIEIKKSRFIGDAIPVADEEETLAALEEIRAEFPTATHHCYAYVTGYPGRIVRMSDDGEPSGTAGRPILEVIERQNLSNTLVVVTRYFGGTLLGAAGLVRAYARAASEAIEAAQVVRYVLHRRWRLQCDYTYWGKLEHFLRSEEVLVAEPRFGVGVTVDLAVPEGRSQGLVGSINDLLNGTAQWEELSAMFLPG